MQYVPSLPPPIPAGVPEEVGEVTNLSEVKKTQDVAEHLAATPAIKLHARPEGYSEDPALAESSGKRHAERMHGDRRTFCRRISHQTLLSELRTEADRRRNKQRKDDPPEHVDTEA
jgi:hypothetical protein